MTAKAGDTLAKVGRRYGLTPGDLARINRFSYNTELHDGQRIVVYSPTGEPPREVAMGLTPEPRRPKGSRRVGAGRQGRAAKTKPGAKAAPRSAGRKAAPRHGGRGEADAATSLGGDAARDGGSRRRRARPPRRRRRAKTPGTRRAVAAKKK